MLKKLLRREDLSADERAEREADKEHAAQVKAAERAAENARKEYATAVATAENELATAQRPRQLAQIGWLSLILYDDRIATPDGTSMLSPAVAASVETSGTLSRRITATRLVTLGVFALAAKKKRDDRELYVVIDTPSFTSVKQLKADKGPQARQFAAKVNTQAKQATGAIRAREQRVAEAQAALEHVKVDRRPALDAAERGLASLTGAVPPLSLAEGTPELCPSCGEAAEGRVRCRHCGTLFAS
jgi:hypothetical protein